MTRVPDATSSAVPSSVQLHPVQLQLAEPLITSHGTTAQREVVFVRVATVDGLVGWGEAAPLPGWPGPDLAHTTADLNRWIASGLSQTPAGGPARAAVDCALLDIAAQRTGSSIAGFLNPASLDTASSKSAQPPAAVKVNALIDALDPDDVERAAIKAVQDGFGTIKLKVATGQADLDRIAAVRRAAPDVRLRLDANQGFDHDGAIAFCQAATEFDIEFIEEPVGGGIAALQAVQAEIGIAVAADESLAAIDVADYRAIPLDTLVVKPSALGHLEALHRLSVERRLVITSFLDSAVGVTMALHLAAAQPPDRPACGLATSGRFRTDVAPAPMPTNGSIAVPTTPGLGVVPQLPVD